MNTLFLKKSVLLGLLASVLLTVQEASADFYSGPSVFLNTAPFATDVYAITCPIGTAKVIAQVVNKTGGTAETISMQVIVPNGRALTANAFEDNASNSVTMQGAGSGNYLISVHKSPSNTVELYDINMDCFDRNGNAFSGTQSTLVQNQ